MSHINRNTFKKNINMEVLSFKDYRIKNALSIQKDIDPIYTFYIDLLTLEKYVEYLDVCGYNKNLLIDFYDILETATTKKEIDNAIHEIDIIMTGEYLNIKQWTASNATEH